MGAHKNRAKLRRRAEDQLEPAAPLPGAAAAAAAVHLQLIHELQVHQLELEMQCRELEGQNKQLRQAQMAELELANKKLAFEYKEITRLKECLLQAQKLEKRRQIERHKANIAERDIQKYLTESYDALCQGQLENALKLLNSVSDENKNITNWSDVSEDLKNKMSKLDLSIRTLQNEISKYKQRCEINSLRLATVIITNGLDRSSYSNKTLLERHYLRLQTSIWTDLKRNWYKFDRGTESEILDQLKYFGLTFALSST